MIYGNPELTQLFLGSGGGPANLDWICCWSSIDPPNGGVGAGIVFISGQTVSFSGGVYAIGDARVRNSSSLKGGAGAGGSIRIEGGTITMSSVSASGGSPSDPYGYGGQGRIAVYYQTSASVNSYPAAYTAFTGAQQPTATATSSAPTSTPTPVPAPQGWYASNYAYSPTIPHAVTTVNRGSFTDSFSYDENGNMTCRTETGVTYIQTYNAENRIASIQKLASGTCASPANLTAKWDFTYDGDGVRPGQSYTPYTDGTPRTVVITRYYFGGAYETTGSRWKKYYSFAGQTIAMRDETGIKYFLTDHLGSVVAVTGADGTLISQQRYLPFGQVREDVGSIPQTDFGYTGQRELDEGMGGIMDYKARFYSPYINRFLQPDSIIPDPSNPQSWNRYSYVIDNPLLYTDPTGHMFASDEYKDSDGKCDKGDKGCNDLVKRIELKKQDKDTKGFYVGDDYPKTLAQREEDIYGGNIVDLLDSTNKRLEEYNNPYWPNVFASIYYKRNEDESINVTGIEASNRSDYRVFVSSILFTSKGKPSAESLLAMCLSLDQCYEPNPLRIRPQMNSDKFMSIDSGSTADLQLIPSGNPLNPNNHFGPSSIQSLTVKVYFRFVPEPGSQVLIFDLIP